MQVVKSSNNVLVALEDEFTVTGPSNRILTSEVIINKKGSESNGELATIEAIRNNKVLVTLNNTGEYRTYAFNHLKSFNSVKSTSSSKSKTSSSSVKNTKSLLNSKSSISKTRSSNIAKTIENLTSTKSKRKTKVIAI